MQRSALHVAHCMLLGAVARCMVHVAWRTCLCIACCMIRCLVSLVLHVAAAGHVADVWVRPVLQWLRDSLHVALSWYMPHVPTGALVGAAEPPKPHSERTDGSALTLTTPSLHLRRLRNLLAAADGEQLAFQRRVCENAFTCRPRTCKHPCARAREKTRLFENAEIRQPLTHALKHVHTQRSYAINMCGVQCLHGAASHRVCSIACSNACGVHCGCVQRRRPTVSLCSVRVWPPRQQFVPDELRQDHDHGRLPGCHRLPFTQRQTGKSHFSFRAHRRCKLPEWLLLCTHHQKC